MRMVPASTGKMLLKINTLESKKVRPNKFASYVILVCCPTPLNPSVSTRRIFSGPDVVVATIGFEVMWTPLSEVK